VVTVDGSTRPGQKETVKPVSFLARSGTFPQPRKSWREVHVLSERPFLPAFPLAELAPGTMRCVEVGAEPVLIVHTKDGGVHAVHNICSHAYARMDEGRLRGTRVICPLHGASFDVRTGAVLGAPANAPLRSFPVRVVDGRVEVQV
jgi:3-phenylpropionate/trans-cinnamate dioxygenase ferredoxin subunit